MKLIRLAMTCRKVQESQNTINKKNFLPILSPPLYFRVARWFLFEPKIPIWEILGGP
jgi:hypothetical protein